MFPSSWKLYLNDFPYFGSSLAHLEPKVQLFEIDDLGAADNDDLSHHHLPNFKQLTDIDLVMAYVSGRRRASCCRLRGEKSRHIPLAKRVHTSKQGGSEQS